MCVGVCVYIDEINSSICICHKSISILPIFFSFAETTSGFLARQEVVSAFAVRSTQTFKCAFSFIFSPDFCFNDDTFCSKLKTNSKMTKSNGREFETNQCFAFFFFHWAFFIPSSISGATQHMIALEKNVANNWKKLILIFSTVINQLNMDSVSLGLLLCCVHTLQLNLNLWFGIFAMRPMTLRQFPLLLYISGRHRASVLPTDGMKWNSIDGKPIKNCLFDGIRLCCCVRIVRLNVHRHRQRQRQANLYRYLYGYNRKC